MLNEKGLEQDNWKWEAECGRIISVASSITKEAQSFMIFILSISMTFQRTNKKQRGKELFKIIVNKLAKI